MKPRKVIRIIKSIAVALACFTWIFPVQSALAVRPAGQKPVASQQTIRVINDVALGVNGELTGQLVNQQGRPLAKQKIVLRNAGRVISQGITNTDGRFVLTGVTSGLYEMVTPGGLRVLRCWSATAAPPSAVEEILVTNVDSVERGQNPISKLMTPLTIGLILAAAASIPFIVNDNGNGS